MIAWISTVIAAPLSDACVPCGDEGLSEDMQPLALVLRAARILLGWDQVELADRSTVSLATIRRFEQGAEIGHLHLAALRRAVEAAGVIVLEDGSDVRGERISMGVALREGTVSGRPPTRRPRRTAASPEN